MRIWNVGTETMNQLYNNLNIIIKPDQIIDLNDDLAVFLLNKKNIRGMGLVQLKDGDSKVERYAQGREQIYNWAKEKWADYEQHCEEKRSINQQPLAPHKEILKYKKDIEDYEKWQAEGSKYGEDDKVDVVGTKVYVCPYCNREGTNKELYFVHLKSHQVKEVVNVNSGAITNAGQGKG